MIVPDDYERDYVGEEDSEEWLRTSMSMSMKTSIR